MPPFTLPPLPYPYDALEPHFDAETMRIHHTKHHQTYITNLNTLLSTTPTLSNLPIAEILTHHLSTLASEQQRGIRNHGGGHANHSFFWLNLASPNSTTLSSHPGLQTAIESTFGSTQHFQTEFETAATKVFGSGWAWLVLQPGGNLAVVTTANQDSPLMGKEVAGVQGRPILGLDVWEHAYYLRYRNVRPDYIKA
ncbi:hypothetical protein LTR62_005381 [Meristemomyces frigidus]|uniref:Superoxide dismutase n=1 Tax=Meristemomyces frigidus TaxID=1508187 RepID=A0AAN7TPR0_9PEZI|nr:hypothetical protein LTR62_005381 [Meristemomyces frigidus]